MISYQELPNEKLKSMLESSQEAVEPRQLEKKPGTSNCVFLLATVLGLVALGFMMSVQLSHDQKTRLLKTGLFWENMMVAKTMNPSRCVTSGVVNSAEFLNSPPAREFKEFVDYINFDKQLDYFMCFSTLFYAMRIERYEPLTIGKNLDKIMGFADTCALWDHAKEDKVGSVAHVHLCTLGNNQTRSIEQLVRDFVKYYDENSPTYSKIKLFYNKFNGEYEVEFAENLKISFHQYRRNSRLATQKFLDGASILDHLRASENLDKSRDFEVEERVSLDSGIIRRVFGYNRAFSVSLEHFKQRPECSYVKYLNTVFKLPNRLDDYIDHFYPQFVIKQIVV